MPLSSDFPYEPRYADALGSKMHYVESGEGDPILLVHGNPTSSYLWRNVIPHVAPQGRVIAVDLIGMGKSDKPDIAYRLFDHVAYLEAFIEELGLDDVTLVLHDWGGGVGLSYARRHPDNVAAVAVMEAVVKPMTWADAGLPQRLMFTLMRNRRVGEFMNMRGTFFLKRVMPMLINRKLTSDEQAAYMEPYPTPQSRKPVAMWPREIAIEGSPADVHEEISANYEWFRSAPVPKLLIHAEPGVIFNTRTVAEISERTANLQTVSVGEGLHYLQEDSPDAIGEALDEWLRESGRVAVERSGSHELDRVSSDRETAGAVSSSV
jgi:haloalkane dehalogenase